MDLSPIHISLYNTLFLIWNYSGWEEKISISRQEVMSMAKIGSANTYLAALKELDKVGMIKYTPSHNPMKGSIVNLYRFDTTTDTSSDTTSGTSTDTTPATLSKRINSKTEKQTNNDLVFPFSGARFLELWANANQIPKWKKKTQNAHQMTLQKLGKFSEEVACAMLEKSIAGDYQGVFDLSAVEIKNIELTARLNNSKPKVDPNNQY